MVFLWKTLWMSGENPVRKLCFPDILKLMEVRTPVFAGTECDG